MPTNGNPLSVYVHIPFCTKKCHYCSFYTIPFKKELIAPYTEALLMEGHRKLSSIPFDFHIVSLFFGGGTPSLLPAASIEKIILSIAPNAQEITLEANPESLSTQYIHDIRSAGVNRISIGVQTLQDSILPVLGRTHAASMALDAVDRCVSQNLLNISLDMIYGLPSQDLEKFCSDITTISTLPITHTSIYNLTIDPHTVFYKYRKDICPTIASEAILSEMSKQSKVILESQGFSQYEIASFAKSSKQSIHNIGYWTDRPFLGLGVSASQYLNGTRSQNVSKFSKYMRAALDNQSTEHFSETLPLKERLKEALCLRLRLIEGAPKKDFPEDLLSFLLKTFSADNLLIETPLTIKLSPKGLLFHDTIAEEIMSFN